MTLVLDHVRQRSLDYLPGMVPVSSAAQSRNDERSLCGNRCDPVL